MIERTAAKARSISPESYRALMRHQAGAVSIIATGELGARNGLTATAVSSLSDSPPTILACVQTRSSAHDLIAARRTFSVNVLASDQQAIAERFAGKLGVRGEDRFEDGRWSTLQTGAPILDDALATLDCELLDQHKFTTHTIFLGTVVAGRFRAEAQPLLYFRNDYWDLGQR